MPPCSPRPHWVPLRACALNSADLILLVQNSTTWRERDRGARTGCAGRANARSARRPRSALPGEVEPLPCIGRARRHTRPGHTCVRAHGVTPHERILDAKGRARAWRAGGEQGDNGRALAELKPHLGDRQIRQKSALKLHPSSPVPHEGMFLVKKHCCDVTSADPDVTKHRCLNCSRRGGKTTEKRWRFLNS